MPPLDGSAGAPAGAAVGAGAYEEQVVGLSSSAELSFSMSDRK